MAANLLQHMLTVFSPRPGQYQKPNLWRMKLLNVSGEPLAMVEQLSAIVTLETLLRIELVHTFNVTPECAHVTKRLVATIASDAFRVLLFDEKYSLESNSFFSGSVHRRVVLLSNSIIRIAILSWTFFFSICLLEQIISFLLSISTCWGLLLLLGATFEIFYIMIKPHLFTST